MKFWQGRQEGQFHPSLYQCLEEIVPELKPKHYLEIGSHEGLSLRTVIEAAGTIESVTICDPWGTAYGGSGRGNHHHIDEMLNSIDYTRLRRYLDGKSCDMLSQIADLTFDLILVDGDHSDEGALWDARTTWPMLNPGGILVFDDLWHPAHTLEPVYRKLIKEFEPVATKTWRDSAAGVGIMRKNGLH